MGVDALFIADIELETGDARIFAEEKNRAAGCVFDKGGLLVGEHRNVTFVGALEQRVNRGAADSLELLVDLLGSDDLCDGRPFDFQAHPATLAVSTVVADGKATGAKGGDGNVEGVTDGGVPIILMTVPDGLDALPGGPPGLRGGSVDEPGEGAG